MATQHLGNLPLDLKRHFSLHVGCTLVISHRYLRPGIEASFLLASAYTTSSRVLLRQPPSGPQLRRPVLSEGLGAFVGRVGLPPKRVLHLPGAQYSLPPGLPFM